MDLGLTPGHHSEPVTTRTPDDVNSPDAWMCEASLRPLDGGEALSLRAFGSSEVEAENEVFNQIAEHTGHAQTLAPDHPIVRELIEVFSLNHDLSEAAETLNATSNVESDVRQMLIAHAITAYGRTFKSNVRSELTRYIDFNDEEASTRELLKVLRNKTIAHSESTMSTTNVLFDLGRSDDGELSITQVRGFTSSTAFPDKVVVAFGQHVKNAQTLLAAKSERLREALTQEFDADALMRLFKSPQRPRFVPLRFNEWDPSKRRPKFQADSEQPLLMGSDEGREGTMRLRIHS